MDKTYSGTGQPRGSGVKIAIRAVQNRRRADRARALTAVYCAGGTHALRDLGAGPGSG